MCHYIMQHRKKIMTDCTELLILHFIYLIQYPVIHKLENKFYRKIENVAINPRTLTCQINFQFYIVTDIISI
jgi:hypothetical protein